MREFTPTSFSYLRVLSVGAKISALAIFAGYWCLTVVYVSPNNYIRARLKPLVDFFESGFYQKWEFFAPPPTFNLRVYAVAVLADNDELFTLDLMSEMIRRKKERAPFNGPEDALDYVLFGAIVTITDAVREAFLQAKTNNPEKSDSEWMDMAKAKLHGYDDVDPAVRALRNYATSALKQHVEIRRVKTFRLRITRIMIPKFGAAMLGRADSAPQEIAAYETKDFTIHE